MQDTYIGAAAHHLHRGGFIQYLLDRDDIQKPWKEYTEHEFVQKMGDGSLPVKNYKYYLIQDYLFLVGPLMETKFK